jgi:glycolate oxidase
MHNTNSVLIADLVACLGEQWVHTDPCILDTYAWQMNAETVSDSRFLERFLAIVLPEDTEQVAAIVRICLDHGVQYKATATGQGPWNGPAKADSAIQIDLRRMNHIFEIDPLNMFAVIEPYVTNSMLQTECMKVGMNCHIHGAGGQASQLASATSFNGHGPDGISLGFSSRNLLGFEWVTPEGEIVRAGSFDSSGSWFCGDGPGPSLRGVIRGFAGAMGGLGVFTKIAVKIYPWTGPAKLKVEGSSPNYYVHIPENHFTGMISLNDFASTADFGYALAEAEIASHMMSNAPSMSVAAIYPSNNKAAKGFEIPLLMGMHRNMYVILASAHKKEARWKQRVINHLTAQHGGGSLGSDGGLLGLANKARFMWSMTRNIGAAGMLRSLPGMAGFMNGEYRVHGYNKLFSGSTPLDNALYGRLTRADANIRTIISYGGSFVTCMGCITTWDVSLRSAQVTLALRKRMIARGQLIGDDDGDADHGGLYEGGTFSHIESPMFYAPNNPLQADFTRRYNVEMNHACVTQKLGVPITSSGPAGAFVFSPAAHSYDSYTSRIKAVFDPHNSAESSWYTDRTYRPDAAMQALNEQVEQDACPINVEEFEVSSNLMPIGSEHEWLRRRAYGELG